MNKAMRVLKVLNGFYGEYVGRGSEDPFRVLIACILSQRTRDANTSRATEALFEVANTPEKIVGLDFDTLRTLIRPSGYFNQKAKYIYLTSRMILDRFSGKAPQTRGELMELPGVGPKTADVVLSTCFNQPAIPVDVHIHRVSRRLGLAPPSSKPGKVKQELESTLPPASWAYIDSALLRIGKEFCRSRSPRCVECPLQGLCDYTSEKDSSGGSHTPLRGPRRTVSDGRTRLL